MNKEIGLYSQLSTHQHASTERPEGDLPVMLASLLKKKNTSEESGKNQSAAYLRRLVFFVLYGAVILKISSTAPFLPRAIAFTTFKTGTQASRTKLTAADICCNFLSSQEKKKKEMIFKWLTVGWVNPENLQARQEYFGIMQVLFD